MAACCFIKSQMSVDSCVFTAAVQCLRLRVHRGRLQVYPRSAGRGCLWFLLCRIGMTEQSTPPSASSISSPGSLGASLPASHGGNGPIQLICHKLTGPPQKCVLKIQALETQRHSSSPADAIPSEISHLSGRAESSWLGWRATLFSFFFFSGVRMHTIQPHANVRHALFPLLIRNNIMQGRQQSRGENGRATKSGWRKGPENGLHGIKCLRLTDIYAI